MRRKHGYDQNELLARRLSKALNIPIDTRALVATPTATPDRRTGSTRELAYRVRDQARLYGKRVLLLEDLITTGIPTAAASRAIQGAGASSVDVMALTRSDRDIAGRHLRGDTY